MLSTYYEPITVPGAKDLAVSERDKDWRCLPGNGQGRHVLEGEHGMCQCPGKGIPGNAQEAESKGEDGEDMSWVRTAGAAHTGP